MNSTLNKTSRALVSALLLICLCFLMTACSKNATKDINGADQICVSGSYAESFMYIVTDEDFIQRMTDIYNSLEYEETDETVDMMTVGEVVSLSFNKGNENLGTLIVDKNNIMTFEAGTQCYRITSQFDFDEMKALVDAQRAGFNVE